MKRVILLVLLSLTLVKAGMLQVQLANQLEENISVLNVKEVQSLIKKEKAIFIGIDRKSKWDSSIIKAKKVVSINISQLEIRDSKIVVNKYIKETKLVVYSKNILHSIVFVQDLKKMGFSNVSYLESGDQGWKEIYSNFRGLKLFSMFIN